MEKEKWYTPPELGRIWRRDPAAVRRDIERGELAAINLAEPGTKRPRYRVSQEAKEAFERSKMPHPPAIVETPEPELAQAPRRKRTSKPVHEYV